MNKYSHLLFVMIFSFLFGDANVQIRLQNGQKSKGEFIGTYMNHVHILVEEKIIYYACDDIISITYSSSGWNYGKGYDYDCNLNTVTADILFPPELDPMTGEMTQMLPDVFNPDIPKPAAKVEDGTKVEPVTTDFDKLVLTDGTTYLGEYSKIEEEIVFFKPQEAFGFQPIPVKRIRRLELKDGKTIIVGGKVKNSLTIEEYQKLSTKAIYDANKVNMWRWVLYSPLSAGVSQGGLLFLEKNDMFEVIPLQVIYFGSISAILGIPYFLLNRKTDFSYPKSITDEADRANYKKVYDKTILKRKVKYIVIPTVIIGGLGLLAFMQAMKDFDMGPQPPGPY